MGHTKNIQNVEGTRSLDRELCNLIRVRVHRQGVPETEITPMTFFNMGRTGIVFKDIRLLHNVISS